MEVHHHGDAIRVSGSTSSHYEKQLGVHIAGQFANGKEIRVRNVIVG